MKDERKNIKEPFHPENTPNPPQIIDPNKRNETNDKDAPIENKQRQENEKRESGNSKGEKPKQVGDAPDIHDETTI